MSSVSNDDRLQPWAQWEIVDVTFPATPDIDTVIQHSLTPQSPEHVNYIPLRKAQAGDIYHNTAFDRKTWSAGYILLRSSVASAKVTLLLTVNHVKRTQLF